MLRRVCCVLSSVLLPLSAMRSIASATVLTRFSAAAAVMRTCSSVSVPVGQRSLGHRGGAIQRRGHARHALFDLPQGAGRGRPACRARFAGPSHRSGPARRSGSASTARKSGDDFPNGQSRSRIAPAPAYAMAASGSPTTRTTRRHGSQSGYPARSRAERVAVPVTKLITSSRARRPKVVDDFLPDGGDLV